VAHGGLAEAIRKSISVGGSILRRTTCTRGAHAPPCLDAAVQTANPAANDDLNNRLRPKSTVRIEVGLPPPNRQRAPIFRIRFGCKGYFLQHRRYANENGTGTRVGSRTLNKPVYRNSPGCSQGCDECEIRCAVIAATRDDLWWMIESLHRDRSRGARSYREEDLEAAQMLLASAEQAFAQVRPSSGFDRAEEADLRTSALGRLH
jgi:hypothetical protein